MRVPSGALGKACFLAMKAEVRGGFDMAEAERPRGEGEWTEETGMEGKGNRKKQCSPWDMCFFLSPNPTNGVVLDDEEKQLKNAKFPFSRSIHSFNVQLLGFYHLAGLVLGFSMHKSRLQEGYNSALSSSFPGRCPCV